MSEVNVFKASVEPLAHLLAGKDIKVRFSRDTAVPSACIKKGQATVVNLPMISDKASTDDLRVIAGSIDHEVGHAIYSTGMVDLKFKSKVEFALFNAVEDARMEREMMKAFRGTSYNLRNFYNDVIDDKFVSMARTYAKLNPEKFKLIALFLSLKALEGAEPFVSVCERYPEFAEITNSIREKFGENPIAQLTSVEDALKLAQDLKKFLKIRHEDKTAKGSSKTTGKKTKGKAGEGEEKGKNGGSKPEKGASENSDEGDAGKPEDTEEESSEDSKKGKAESESKETKAGRLKPLRPEDLDEISALFSRKVEKAVKSAMSADDYVVLSTDKDLVEYIEPTFDTNIVQRIEEETHAMTSALQKNLERAISARSIAIWTPGQRRGKIHNASLYKLFQNDPKIFKKKQECRTKDVSVSLLIDCSGSMSGEKARLACSTGYALTEVLTRMGIRCEVLGFTTGQSLYTDFKEARKYARIENLYMPIFKGFNDRFDSQAKLRFGKMWQDHWMANNVDGECVQIAANRLMAQTTKGKILMVLSDGFPAAYGSIKALSDNLTETVNELSKKIDIVGIGIMSEAVKAYYPKSVVINEINELPTTVIQQIKQLLIA